MDIRDLLFLEQTERDSFRVKKLYIDLSGDLVAGILLGQIIYWHLPNSSGQTKMRVFKENRYWLAKAREEWHDEIRITPKQFDRAKEKLIDKGFIDVKRFKFNGTPTLHIALNIDILMNAINNSKMSFNETVSSILPKGEIPIYPNSKMELTKRDKSLTETTTKITTETTTEKYPSDSDEYRLASYLFNFIKRNNSKTKEPNIQKWAKQFDLILRVDKRAVEEVQTVIRFSQEDDFWYKNILSPEKLRKHFDKLTLQMQEPKRNKNKGSEQWAMSDSNYTKNNDLEELEKRLLGWE